MLRALPPCRSPLFCAYDTRAVVHTHTWSNVRSGDATHRGFFPHHYSTLSLQTPLHLSASGGHVACSRLLLEREAPVNARDRSGRTPLHVAVQQARGGIVALLIEYGCDVDAADCEGRTPLHYAAALGHGGCAGALVNAECDLSARDSAGLSPAHVAARAGHAAVLSVFLDARPEEAVARDERGKTPLHYAAAAARATCVRLLVDRKADISERDDEGHPARPRPGPFGAARCCSGRSAPVVGGCVGGGGRGTHSRHGGASVCQGKRCTLERFAYSAVGS
eukprot:Opistho-1_new@38868